VIKKLDFAYIFTFMEMLNFVKWRIIQKNRKIALKKNGKNYSGLLKIAYFASINS